MSAPEDMHKCPHLVIEGSYCENCGWWVGNEDPPISAERMRQSLTISKPSSDPLTDEELRQRFMEKWGH